MTDRQYFICDTLHTPLFGPFQDYDTVIKVCELLQALKLYKASELWAMTCDRSDGEYKYLYGGCSRVDDIIECHKEAVKMTGKECKSWQELVEAVRKSVL